MSKRSMKGTVSFMARLPSPGIPRPMSESGIPARIDDKQSMKSAFRACNYHIAAVEYEHMKIYDAGQI